MYLKERGLVLVYENMPDSWSFIMWVCARVCLRERKRDIYFECVCVSGVCVGVCERMSACV